MKGGEYVGLVVVRVVDPEAETDEAEEEDALTPMNVYTRRTS